MSENMIPDGLEDFICDEAPAPRKFLEHYEDKASNEEFIASC